jgi:hypothetical protein
MTGPEGHGPPNGVSGSTVLPFQVAFANTPMATASARPVVVTDPFAANLDLSKFQSSAISIGDMPLKVSPGSQITVEGKGLDVATHADQTSDEDPSPGIDPGREALVTSDAVIPKTNVSAATSKENGESFAVDSTGQSNPVAVDPLLVSAGSSTLVAKPHPHFTLIDTFVTRSNPPGKTP